MTLAGLIFGFLIASGLGLLYHLVRGGRLMRLFLYLATAWISFFSGHFVGEWFGLSIFRFGSLNLLTALLGTILGLFLANLLAPPERRYSRSRRGTRKRGNNSD
jgi:hypothetical protein